MRAFSLSTIVHLAQAITLTLAIPTKNSSILPRSQFCTNAPTTIAGTPLPRGTLPPRSPLPYPASTIWCQPHSSTYIALTYLRAIPGPAIPSLLADACSAIVSQIARHGDGLVTDGGFHWVGQDGMSVDTVNANNHQQTWGVLGAAIAALASYMQEGVEAGPGSAYFVIFDGENEVGVGMVG